jgi:hypothetical protein
LNCEQEGKGKIDIHDLREACINYGLPVDVWLLEQVFDYCDADRDGQINYLEFANFLNWKEKLPSGFADVPCECCLERNNRCNEVKRESVMLCAFIHAEGTLCAYFWLA